MRKATIFLLIWTWASVTFGVNPHSYVIDSAGGNLAYPHGNAISSIGQGTPLGRNSSESYVNYSGFLHPEFVIEREFDEPIASIQATPSIATAPLSTTLIGTNSRASTGHEITLYEWDVNNDGDYEIISVDPIVGWVYPQASTNTAILKVSDNSGKSAIDSIVITATTIMSNEAPGVLVEAIPDEGIAPLETTLIAYTAEDRTIVMYEWDFNDDGIIDLTNTIRTATYIYDYPSNYVARVIVHDEFGLSATDTINIGVTEPVSGSYKIMITSPVIPNHPERVVKVGGSDVPLKCNIKSLNSNKDVGVQYQYKGVDETTWINYGPLVFPPPNSYAYEWDVTGLINNEHYNLRTIAVLYDQPIATSPVYRVVVRHKYPSGKIGGFANDVDQDGMNDSWELANFGSSYQGGSEDHDQDGISNDREFLYNTNPLESDSDYDGQDDRDEIIAGTDPTNPHEAFSIVTYGVTNVVEASCMVSDTRMLSSSSPLTSTANLSLSWQSHTNRLYRVVSTTDLCTWTNIESEITGDGNIQSWQYTGSYTEPLRFFRLSVEYIGELQ